MIFAHNVIVHVYIWGRYVISALNEPLVYLFCLNQFGAFQCFLLLYIIVECLTNSVGKSAGFMTGWLYDRKVVGSNRAWANPTLHPCNKGGYMGTTYVARRGGTKSLLAIAWLGGAVTQGTLQLNGVTSQEGTRGCDRLSDNQYIAALPNSQVGNSTFYYTARIWPGLNDKLM